MTFFYDLNKRLANLSQQQTLTEGAVAERATGDYSATKARAGKDIGKPGKNFSKIAADAGQRYGSKAAGERVAGAVLNKLRHPKEGMAEAVRGLTVGDQGYQPPTTQAQRDATAQSIKQNRAVNRADTRVTGYGNRVEPQQGAASGRGYNTGTTVQRTQPSYGGQETPVDFKPSGADVNPKHIDRYGNLQIKPGQGKGVAEADLDEVSRGEYIKQQDNAAEKSGKQKFNAFGQTFDTDEIDEGGMPMTTVNGKRVPKFAADGQGANDLAKKKSFNDKIAGAKQEVEEMLGDVAAEAMRSALGGKKQMADEGAGQFYVYHKTKGDRAGGADYDLLKTFPDKDSATSFAQKYNNKISADKKNFHSAVVRTKSVKKDMDEGWDEMERDVKSRMGPRVGDVKRGARHDIETTATGVRATRRYDDEEDAQPTGEKRKAGRPKGADKGPERVTAKAYKHKGSRIKEEGIMPGATDDDTGEYGNEGDMAKDQIHTIVRHAKALEKILSNKEDLPEWVQAKLSKIESMMSAVDDYMETQHERGAEMDQGIDLEEESTDTRDNRAERAGKRVTKDLEYDMKHKGKDDAKAERAGRKVTKDIEYDEKKKEKKVAETTSSGSVATGGDAPKSTKGGVQIGKGIYDSLNREVENMISESMSVNVSMTNDDNGSHKNITVTAADEDAEMLAQLLARAGLGGGMSHDHGHGEPCSECGSTDCGCDDVCPDCGQSPCACDQMMDEAYGDTTATENHPNWPTNTEYSDDAMQYSGGLNKPKASGMATIPVTDVQIDGEDKFGEIDRLREMAGIKQQELKPWERTMKEAAVEEGVVDAVKGAVKKGLEKLGHGSDEEMRKDLQKKMGVPATGQKPADKKMEESLMQEFANFKI
jgi:hypothetical protein